MNIITNLRPRKNFYSQILDSNFEMHRKKERKKERKESEVSHPCPTLHNPMDCSLQGSSIHGILQARVLEWVAISFSRGSF